MARQILQQRRQPWLPSLFLPIVALAIFCATSSFVVWQLHARPYDDLPSFYWATQVAFEQLHSPYHREYFRLLEGGFGQKIYPFLYPPPSLLLFSPFLLFDEYEDCKLFFTLLNLFLWWVIVWQLFLLCRHLLGGRSVSVGVLAVIALTTLFYLPLVDTIKNGQVNLLVLACLLPLMMPMRGSSGRWVAGVLLACAILFKVYVLLLIPVLLIFGRWREVLVAIVVLLCLAALGAALLPAGLWSDWLALSRSAGYGRGVPGVLTVPFNQSINGFFIRMFLEERGSGHATTWILWIYLGVIICISIVAYAIFNFLRYRTHGQIVATAMTLLLINLVAPLTWQHHYVLALPAALCTVLLLYSYPAIGDWLWRILAIGFVLCLAAPYVITGIVAPTLSPAVPVWQTGLQQNLVQSAILLAGLGIFVVLAVLGKRGSPISPGRSGR